MGALEAELESFSETSTIPIVIPSCVNAAKKMRDLIKLKPKSVYIEKCKKTITDHLNQYKEEIADWLTEYESIASPKIQFNYGVRYSDLFDLEGFLIFEKFCKIDELNSCFLAAICDLLSTGRRDDIDYFARRCNACIRIRGSKHEQEGSSHSK